MIDGGASLVAAGICASDRGKPGHARCHFCHLTIPELESAVETFWRRDDAEHLADIYNQEPPALRWRRLAEAQRVTAKEAP